MITNLSSDNIKDILTLIISLNNRQDDEEAAQTQLDPPEHVASCGSEGVHEEGGNPHPVGDEALRAVDKGVHKEGQEGYGEARRGRPS